MDGDRKPKPTMEEIREIMISDFLSKIESSSRQLARLYLEARQWHSVNAAVSDFNDAVAASVQAAAEDRRNETNRRNREVHLLAAARTLSSIPRAPVSSPPPIRLRSPRSPPSRESNPFSREAIQRADNDSDEQQHDAALPSSSSLDSLPRRLKFRSMSEILSNTPQVIPRTITIWRNGFTVDDNPLFTLDNPVDASFLKTIESMDSPRTLDSPDGKQRFLIKLIRRQQEDFPESSKPFQPFQGAARTLASDEPPASSEPTQSAHMEIDFTAPMTLITVVLSDGTRIVSRFNTHHTIRNVRDFVDASTPDATSRDYQLIILGFPPTTLTDLDQTIEQAGISKSVLTQKF